jgi:uncharacterized protein YndB with AHSA1/START domain
VELVSDRRFRFAATPEAFWAAAGATDDFTRWWPWLRTFEARALVTGDRWRCAVRPPLRYTVRFTVRLDEVVAPTSIAASIDGDIAGRARLDVAPDRDGCEVRLTSSLSPASRVFGLVAAVAGPLVRRGHDWILDTGAEQFARRALRDGAPAPARR